MKFEYVVYYIFHYAHINTIWYLYCMLWYGFVLKYDYIVIRIEKVEKQVEIHVDNEHPRHLRVNIDPKLLGLDSIHPCNQYLLFGQEYLFVGVAFGKGK